MINSTRVWSRLVYAKNATSRGVLFLILQVNFFGNIINCGSRGGAQVRIAEEDSGEPGFDWARSACAGCLHLVGSNVYFAR